MKNQLYAIALITLVIAYFAFRILGGKIQTDNEFNRLYDQRLDGKVIGLKYGSRGVCNISFSDGTDSVYYLPGAFFFKENSITIGDSVFKKAHTDVIFFYKINNDGVSFCCSYDFSKSFSKVQKEE
jgi:hypothetical protein